MIDDREAAPMRAFVAVEMAEPIREALSALIGDLRRLDAPVKWVEAQNIHLTLKFLGSVPDASVARAVEILRECADGMGPFSLEIAGAGGFPDLKRPRVIFVCAADQPPVAAELARRLNEQMAEIGAERDDRPYQNHITLGRVREPRHLAQLTQRLESLQGKSFGSMQAAELTLMESRLTPAGPIYSPVERVRLAG
ncbi:MAG: RNA 2',3'-cyclic phosphodiesterase [Candidatus Brocadiia bacterium]|jgi:2'-5' RNA ligase